MKVYIVGTGMDGSGTLTAEADKIISDADVLVGAKRMTDPFVSLGKPVYECWKADGIREYLDGCGYESAAVLMSGDCGFFSGAKALRDALSGHETRVIAGISTPVYMCAKLGIPWQDMKFVSLHGADAGIAVNVRANRRCFFLLGGSVTPRDICKRLTEYGLGSVTVHVGARLAYSDERVFGGAAAELAESEKTECDGLCAVITENDSPVCVPRFGMPDGMFTRGSVPMTKSEVRAVIASKLCVGMNDTVWDIGCGTGSVSVEAALACSGGNVFALDRNEDAVKLTNENARQFGCDNIHTLCGSAPDALAGLPAPDRLFIGGAGGCISGILDAALAGGKKPKAVITAVTLETLDEAVGALKEKLFAVNVTQVSAVRTKAVGSHTMFDAQNPVFVIEGDLE